MGSSRMRPGAAWTGAWIVAAGALVVPGRSEAAFAYRKPLSIAGAQVVGGPHTDFPVLVSVVDANLATLANGGGVRRAQGYDIEFRASDGITVLDHEVETYEGATGRLVAWVRFPGTAGPPDTRIQNGVSTSFFVYYGDPDVVCARNNPGRVWINNYRYVYHFNQTGAGAAPLDSTANAVTAVVDPNGQGVQINKGNTLAPLNGYGWDLDLTATGQPSAPLEGLQPTANSWVQVQDADTPADQAHTIEAWFSMDVMNPGYVGIVTKGRDQGAAGWTGLYKIDTGELGIGNLDGGNVQGTTVLQTGRWYYGAVTWTTTRREVYLYDALDGFLDAAVTNAVLTGRTRVGDDSNGRYLDGRVDEVRVSNVARSQAWIQTQARNQTCPSSTATNGCPAYSGITTSFLSAGAEQAAPASTFVNATSAGGLGLGGSKEGGLAWGDLNGDGCLDALVNTSDPASRSRVFLQAKGSVCAGSFTDVTQCLAGGLLASDRPRSALWGDLNGDGRLDFVRNTTDPIELYLNNGPGNTTGLGCGAGVGWTRFGPALSGNPSQTITGGLNTEGLGLVDYDADGDLDLFLDNQNVGALRVAGNDGTGTLALLASGSAGLPAGGLGFLDYAAVTDLDADGRVDLLWRTETGADLYFNQGGTFVAATGAQMPFLAASNLNKGGVAFCDFDGDGDFDLVWTDAPNGQTQVWQQTGVGSRSFVATGLPTGLGAEDIDGVTCPDIDNDGDVDLVLSGSNHFVFRNNGGFPAGGTFTDVTPGGFGGAADGEGIVAGDYDRDGDLDVLINQNGLANELWRNETNSRGYLVVRALVGSRDAIGATASLYSCTGTRVTGVREVNGGEGHGSQAPPLMHFGLPSSGSPSGYFGVYEVRVRFVGGALVRKAVLPGALGCYQQVTVSSGDADDLAACAASAVRLTTFTAAPGNGSVTLEWRTGSELSNLGFHVYRGPSARGPWTRLTSALIPGLGSSPIGQAYSWLDEGLANGLTYFYRLEDVDTASVSTFHGPVSAVPVAPVEPPPSGGGGSGSGGGGAGPTSTSCPAWVLAALGTSSSGAVECTKHGNPDAGSLDVLSRDARGATLELRTGGFWTVRTLSGASEASGTVRVFVPGFDTPADASAPALPLRRALVEAEVGKKVRLVSAEALDLRGFEGLRPSAVGVAEMAVSRDGTVRPGRRAVAAPRLTRGYLPQHVARLAGTVFQGETKSAVVEMTPVRFDGYLQQLVLASRVLVRLAFTGRQSEETGTGSTGRMARRRATPLREVLAQLHTSGRGLHALGFEAVFPSRQRGMAVSRLRLQRQGQAVGFRVEPATGVFGPGSTLYFFADKTASSTDYSSEVAWELVRSTSGQGMGVVPGTPEGGPAASAATGFASFETNRFYQSGLLEAPDVWLWEGMVGGNPARTVSFALSGVDRASAQPALLSVSLQGGSESGTAEEHLVQVSLNDAVVGEARFAGKKPYRLSLGVAASQLVEGANRLSVLNVGDTGVYSLVFLDKVSVSYPQAPVARGGAFEGTWGEGGTVEVAGVTVSPVVLDVTDSSSPGETGAPRNDRARWVAGLETTPGTVRFRAEAGHRYVVVSREGLLTPRIEWPVPSTLRDGASQAEYLVIGPREFLPAAEPLLVRRESQGLTTMAVAFEEIAEVFGQGQPSAEAIREFLAFAYHSWSRPSPRYVVLLGDSTHDPRHFQASSWASPLPALRLKTSYLWTVSDPALAAVNGTDGVPDLSVGRLPAQTRAEAEALVSKLLAWEDSGQDLSGKAVLVADDPDAAGDFEADVADIRARFLGGRASEVLKVRELQGGTRAAIAGAFDDGASLMSYVGHGGTAVWASENVWSSWDAPSLQAQSAQPVLLTMNCLNGYFVAPNFESLSEAMVKAEGRGAIAAFSPSGMSLDGPAHQYHAAVAEELVSGRHARLGDAILAAQKAYAQSGLMPELLAVYQLLGDPAMPVR